MKMVYTNENRFMVNNARNILEASGIEVVLKNEYAQGSAGDLSPFDTWMELWVMEDSQFDKAKKIIELAFKKDNRPEWQCRVCHEHNDASFDLCWHCQSDKP